jgi:hypothetical protein
MHDRAFRDVTAVPDTAELVARARGLRATTAANAAAGEQDRRVTEDSIMAMTGAGLFKIAVPRRYGGYETSVRIMLEVSAAVGEADGATSWVPTLVNVCNWMVGLFPEQAQDDIYRRPGSQPGPGAHPAGRPEPGRHLVRGRDALLRQRLIDTARLHAFRAADHIDAAAARGEYPATRWSRRR